MIYKMDYLNIMKILLNREYNKTFDDISKIHNIDNRKDLKFEIKDTFILKNNNAFQYLNKFNYRSDYNIIINQTLLEKDIIDYFVINHYDGKYNYFMIVVGIDTEKINNEFYDNFKNYQTFSNENRLFVMYLLTLMKYHFEEINNIKNNSNENLKISQLIELNTIDYHSHKSINQPSFLKSNLYLYQKANLYWMKYRELYSPDVILDDSMIINWGPNLEFNFETLSFQEKRTIENYSKDKINNFKGGCLCDDVGLGKTIQIFTLCLLEESNNLIIVPEHLLNHWINEYNKHINAPSYVNSDIIKENGNLIIVSYNNITQNLLNFNWDRVIIDEYHEIITKPNYDVIKNIKSKYKWAITATPFINKDIVYYLINYIGKNKIESKKISKYKMYINVYAEIFRRNTKKTIENELKLPKIKEITYYLNLSAKERLFYDSIQNLKVKNKEKDAIRKQYCITPYLYFTEKKN